MRLELKYCNLHLGHVFLLQILVYLCPITCFFFLIFSDSYAFIDILIFEFPEAINICCNIKIWAYVCTDIGEWVSKKF